MGRGGRRSRASVRGGRALSRRLQLGVKWLFDRVGAAVLLVLLSPLLAALAVWIALDSGRPVVFVQRRAGEGNRPFSMLKFRTMVPDAAAEGTRLGLTADPHGVVPGDPRITGCGRFLRRTGLDELPQLWNVLVGDMSFVGPRPDLVEQVANYTEHDRRRLTMPPGITGWPQVNGREEIGWPERIELDIWYVENWSLWLDLRILVRTAGQLFRTEPVPVEDTMNIERARARSAGALAELDREAWDAFLEERGAVDVYFLSAYVEGSRELDPGRPVYLRLSAGGGDVVFALLLRDEPADVTTPYGFGGPVALGEEPPVERFWQLYGDWCAERGVVSSFIRFHPLLGNHRWAGEGVHVERLGHTVGWPLGGVDDLLAAMHKHHRRVVRKALREDLTPAVRERPESIAGFVELYEETMERNEAADFYRFPPGYWSHFTGPLADRVVLSEVYRGGRLLSSALCLAAPPWLHYHLGGTSEEGRTLGAAHLALFEAARWARERGFERFHLGAGVGGGAGPLFEFKERFSPGSLFELHVGKAVHDPAAYRELTGGDPKAVSGYFPGYRAKRVASRPS